MYSRVGTPIRDVSQALVRLSTRVDSLIWSLRVRCLTAWPNVGTEPIAYNDSVGTWEKCHCNQIVTVSRGSLLTNQSFGNCKNCHCDRFVTVTDVTVTDRICNSVHPSFSKPSSNQIKSTSKEDFQERWFCLQVKVGTRRKGFWFLCFAWLKQSFKDRNAVCRSIGHCCFARGK